MKPLGTVGLLGVGVGVYKHAQKNRSGGWKPIILGTKRLSLKPKRDMHRKVFQAKSWRQTTKISPQNVPVVVVSSDDEHVPQSETSSDIKSANRHVLY